MHTRILIIILLSSLAGTALAQEIPAKVVQVAQVERKEIAPTVAVPGTVFSRNDVQVTAGVAGQLLMVAEPGTIVQKGEPVARIDKRPLQLQRAEQEALLQRAEINVRQLESQLRRQRELQGSNLVSEFELEQTEANRDLAISDANITRVRIQQIDDLIRRADVRAPFTGVVISRAFSGGEDVARGAILAQLTDIHNMEVRAFVPLKHLSRTVVGDEIAVFAADASLSGRIRALVPTGDVRSQTFEARIDLPLAVRSHWTVGQLVSVAVPIRARASTIAVPRDALVLRHNGSFVFRVTDENIAEQISVQIGDSAGEMVAVTGSLAEGDRVAIRGAENLQEGASVKIMTSQGNTATGSTVAVSTEG
jgi:RND family efflux transporter MFP subunit